MLGLVPRRSLAYGQDAVMAEVMQRAGLTAWHANAEGYPQLAPDAAPALVVSHNPTDPADAHFIAALPPAVPVVAHLHLRWSYLDEQQEEALRRCAARASVVVGCSPFQPADTPLTGIRWALVPNGVDAKRYHPSTAAERAAFRRMHGLLPDAPVIAHVGRLEEAKGLDVLIALASRLADATLLVQFLANEAAGGRYAKAAERVRHAAPERVRLSPDDDPSATPRPVRLVDALVLPSLCEVAPLVAIEALMCGVPVVATDSTPFFADLRREIPGVPVHTVALPERLRSLHRADLRVRATEAKQIADELGGVLRRVVATPSADHERHALHAAMRERGYDSAAMAEGFAGIYAATAAPGA